MTDPPSAEACFELIRRHRAARRPDLALAVLHDLLGRDESPFTRAQLGVQAVELAEPALGVSLLSQALPYFEDIAFREPIERELAVAEALVGRFETGWLRQRRIREPPFIWQLIKRYPQSIQDILLAHADRYVGRDVAGRSLLILWEGGVGDLFDMVRYCRLLKANGARKVVLHAPLICRDVLATCPFVDEVTESFLLDEMLTAGAIDGWTLLFTLRAMLQTTPFHPAWPDPYLPLTGAADSRSRSRARLGLVWKSGSNAGHEPYRSVGLAGLEPLLACGLADFVSLQFGEATLEERALIARHGVEDRSADIVDFSDMARLIGGCDGIISVDTAAAHLAGGMGVGVWLMLAAHHDPRWSNFDRYTPLYPAMRLYRQPSLGDWASVAERMIADLAGRGFPGD